MDRIKRQILQSLVNGKQSVYKLIDRQDSSLKEFYDLIQGLKGDILFWKNGQIHLTDKGLALCRKLGIKKRGESPCPSCGGTGYVVSEDFSNVLNELSRISENRPEAVEKYDQGFMSLEGVVKRVEFIHERGDLAGTRIFVLGDDDLFSLAAALTGMPEEVRVVDVDQRLISFINKNAEENGLPIKAEVYDVQYPLPEKLRERFDVFITDPVETLPGIRLFLSRAVSSLKGRGSAGYFGLTTLEASSKKWYNIEKMLLEMGFVITDIRRKFNVYPIEDKNFFRFEEDLPIVRLLGTRADYDWYTSSFLRIEAVRTPVPQVTGVELLNDKVYRDDESLATPY